MKRTFSLVALAGMILFAANARANQSPYVTGVLGPALQFDGSTDYADFGNPSDQHLDLGTNATIETWVRFAALPSGTIATIASKDVGSGSTNKWIFGYNANYAVSGNQLIFGIETTGQSIVWLQSNAWTPNTGVWYHVALVKSGNNYTFYLNGAPFGTTTSTVSVPTVASDFILGQAESNFYVNGTLDDTRIWNIARATLDIQSDFDQELTGTETGLVGYWKFNEGSGTTLLDSTANHTNGTFVGTLPHTGGLDTWLGAPGGGDGTSWSDKNNWSTVKVPGSLDTVVIPVVSGTTAVNITTAVQVASLTSSEPITITNGSLTVISPVTLPSFTVNVGTVTVVEPLPGSVASLTVSGAATIAGASLYAAGGGAMVFTGATSYTGNNYANTSISATGLQSRISLTALTTFNGGGHNSGGMYGSSYSTSILPTSGGEIDLAGPIGVSSNANNNILTLDSTGGILGVSGITSLTNTNLTDSGGMSLTFGSALALTGVNIAVSGGSQVSFPTATSYTGNNFANTSISASGSESKISLTALTTFNGGGYNPYGYYGSSYSTSILPTSGGEIDLAGPIGVTNRALGNIFTSSGGGTMNFLAQSSISNSSFSVTSGALTINISPQTTISGSAFNVTSGTLTINNLATVNASNVTWTATNIGSEIFFPDLTTITADNGVQLIANGGEISAPLLTSFKDSVNGTSALTITDPGTMYMPLLQRTGIRNLALNVNVAAAQSIDAFATIPNRTDWSPYTLTLATSSGLPVTFSVLSGPATVSGNVLHFTGGGTVVVAADQPGNLFYSAASEVTTSFTVPSSQLFANWAALYFTPAQISNPAIGGPAAIPLNDGVPNLLCYFCDINPSVALSATNRAALPTAGLDTTSTPGTTYLTLTYRQYALETGITVSLQTSTDGLNWTTANPPDISQQVGYDPITGDPLMEMGVKATGTTQYLRLSLAYGASTLTTPAESAPYTFSTLAGSPGIAGSTNGSGGAVEFSSPTGITFNPHDGNLYVSDANNQTVRKISGGVVTTFAGTVGVAGLFDSPEGIAADASGNLYVANLLNSAIGKITPAGAATLLTHIENLYPGGKPNGVAVDTNGNLYICDTNNHIIVEFDPATLAFTNFAGSDGKAGSSDSTDGTGATARFNQPNGIAIDANNNLYVADTGNNTIRKITPAGVVTTIAGTAGVSGSIDGIGTAAQFNSPFGIAVDANDNLYVADTYNNAIREISPAGVVTTLAGSAGITGSANGLGSAAQFNSPYGITVDTSGNLYVTDYGNNTIRVGGMPVQAPVTSWGNTGADSSWVDSANWSAGVPTVSSNVFIGTQPTNNLITVNTGVSTTIAALTFSNTLTAGVTLAQATAETLQVNGAITNSSAQAETLSIPVIAGLSALYSGGTGGLNFAQLAVNTNKIATNGTVSVAGGILTFQINSLSSYGQIGPINTAGTTINISGTYTGAAGDTFRLTTGNFSGATLGTLPTLSPGLAWNTTSFLTNGTLSVVSTATNNQTITPFATIPTQVFREAPFTITLPTSTSGLPVSVTVVSGPATISGNTITLTGAGTVVLAADQAGNAFYTPAPEVTTGFAVSQATAIVTLGSLTQTYNGAPQSATATTTPSGLNVTLTYNGNATPPVAVGSYTVVGTINDPNYQGSTVGTLTISPATSSALAITSPPSALLPTSVELNGSVNASGGSFTVAFEYGTDGVTFPNQVAATPGTITGNSFTAASASLSNLTAGTTYYYRIAATGSGGTAVGAIVSFTTPTGPIATTNPATFVTSQGAQLNGTVNPEGADTTVTFQYSTDLNFSPNLTTTIPAVPGTVASSTQESVILASTTPLSGNVTASLQVNFASAVASSATWQLGGQGANYVSNAGGTIVSNLPAGTYTIYFSQVAGFVTPPPLQVTLTAGQQSTYVATYGQINSAVPVSATVTGLAPNTIYYYELVAMNANGMTTSAPLSIGVDTTSNFGQMTPTEPSSSAYSGSLQVNLATSGIISGWRFVGEELWRASGTTVTGLLTGQSYEVEYETVPGYNPPVPESVTISSVAPSAVINRSYYPIAPTSPATPTGGLQVNLSPSNLTGAQWQFSGQSNTQWYASGATVDNLSPGVYLVVCSPVAGQTTPSPTSISVPSGATTTVTLAYTATTPQVGVTPSVLPFSTVTTSPSFPYGFVGQIRTLGTSRASATGFVVSDRVVATAAHVVFDDDTQSYFPVSSLQWLFQRQAGVYEPVPQTPVGYYVLSGYASARAADTAADYPSGTSSPTTYDFDAAAMYFFSSAGGGGYSGYLSSDLNPNQFLTSSSSKMLVGYPVDGFAESEPGQMFATTPVTASFAQSPDTDSSGNPYQIYTTTGMSSAGGNSGGPLCVQYSDGNYYPAAIYLGGSNETVVRAIDSEVVDLFNRAEVSGGGGVINNSGGITQYNTTISGGQTATSSIRVNFSPGAPAGAGWSLGPISTNYPAFPGGSTISNLYTDGSYLIYFSPVDGFLTLPPVAANLVASNLDTVTATYEGISAQPQNVQTATVGVSATFTVGVSGTPTAYQWQYVNGGTVTNILNANSATYTIPSVTVNNQGSYQVVVTWGSDGSLTSAPATLSIAVPDPTATPQNDGVTNLLKYIFDINPTRPMTASDRMALPLLSTATVGQTSFLTLTYQQYQNLNSNVVVTVQSSTDLVHWSTPAGASITQIGTNANNDFKMQAKVPITSTRQFIRLDATLP